jgi:hypothetical protein
MMVSIVNCVACLLGLSKPIMLNQGIHSSNNPFTHEKGKTIVLSILAVDAISITTIIVIGIIIVILLNIWAHTWPQHNRMG